MNKSAIKEIVTKYHLTRISWFLISRPYRSYLFHFGQTCKYIRNEYYHWINLKYLERKYKDVLHNASNPVVEKEHPRIIWWCWLQGEKNAPDLCKACLNSLRKYYPDYQINIITSENFNEYIDIPQFILDKYNKGIINRTKFSNILRIFLLVEHGGLWIDSTVLCTGRRHDLFCNDLFVYQNWAFNQEVPVVASNWLIYSVKAHPIMVLVKDLHLAYWRDHNKLIDYYVFHLLFHMAIKRYFDLWQQMPKFSNIPPHMLQFEIADQFNQKRWDEICSMSDFHKLNFRADVNEMKGTYYEYIIRNCFCN